MLHMHGLHAVCLDDGSGAGFHMHLPGVGGTTIAQLHGMFSGRERDLHAPIAKCVCLAEIAVVNVHIAMVRCNLDT